MQTAEGKLYLFVAIDRTSKFTYTELHQKAGKMAAAQFLRNLIASVPYTIHTVLTDNGVQFTNRATDIYAGMHIFDRVCEENGVEHRQTKVKHPWTNGGAGQGSSGVSRWNTGGGQVERMNRTIKEATVKRFHYENHNELSSHLTSFVAAYNFAKRLKTLKGLTPYEFICKAWTNQPKKFKLNPLYEMPGLNRNSSACPWLRRRHSQPLSISSRVSSTAMRQSASISSSSR